ncbi:MAG: hypothetical protein ACI4UM_00015 [Succinivibrio sp.]
MKAIRIFLYICSAAVLSIPLIYIISENNSYRYLDKNDALADSSSFGDICDDGNYSKCLIQRDKAIEVKDFYRAFVYLKKLCEGYKDSQSCAMTYNIFYALKADTEKLNSIPKVTLYEVLYYLDIGCKLNNYDSCMKAGRIYESGNRPSANQTSYGYNVSYDPQEAKRYYQKVCHSISDNSYEACSKIVELTETIHRLSVR